jgi:hypothetical protein
MRQALALPQLALGAVTATLCVKKSPFVVGWYSPHGLPSPKNRKYLSPVVATDFVMINEVPADALMACPDPQEPPTKSPELSEFCAND